MKLPVILSTMIASLAMTSLQAKDNDKPMEMAKSMDNDAMKMDDKKDSMPMAQAMSDEKMGDAKAKDKMSESKAKKKMKKKNKRHNHKKHMSDNKSSQMNNEGYKGTYPEVKGVDGDWNRDLSPHAGPDVSPGQKAPGR